MVCRPALCWSPGMAGITGCSALRPPSKRFCRPRTNGLLNGVDFRHHAGPAVQGRAKTMTHKAHNGAGHVTRRTVTAGLAAAAATVARSEEHTSELQSRVD